MPQEFKPDLIPGGNPEDPNYRKPPGGVSVSLAEVESIVEPKQDGEQQAEKNFSSQLDQLAKEVNP